MNNKGFTLIELIVTISIFGIIVLLALPLIRNVQQSNKNRKFALYRDNLIQSAKLYVDSYGEDVFGTRENGCSVVTYEQLAEAFLLKDIGIDDLTCYSDETKVGILKKGSNYTYNAIIACGPKKSNEKLSNPTIYYPENKKINEETCLIENA